MKIVGASIGKCIHTTGLLNFLRIAEGIGHRTEFVGASVSPQEFAEAIQRLSPELAVVSYRLSPQTARRLLEQLREELLRRGLDGIRMAFGGTPPVADVAEASGLFERVFRGGEPAESILAYLSDRNVQTARSSPSQNLVERIKENEPFPLLRHHLGLSTIEKTVEEARKIARTEALDVLSIAPDQNAQESFFRPREMRPEADGAGGVPLRTPQDLRRIYEVTRCGNYPLLRCYSGTRDLIRWAEMLKETINIAWGAVPLFWYSELDKRSARPLEEAIHENQQAIRWYAEHGIPVEVNDPHQWSLRDAHDAVAVAVSYLSAYNAKKLTARFYVNQLMLNTPPLTSPAMDIAKMLAKLELVESLHDGDFHSFRQIRTGLRSMPYQPELARGHLSASIAVAMPLEPHIVHIVSYCEALHPAGAREIIESSQIVRGVINHCLRGMPDPAKEPAVQRRKNELLRDARLILDAIRRVSTAQDPLTDPDTLARAVRLGILDAPHLCGSGIAPGALSTASVNGAQLPIDPETGEPIAESTRLERILSE